jgi:TPR repeat protein
MQRERAVEAARQDPEAALRQAAQAGDNDAAHQLGQLLEERGQAVEAERWYRRSAEAGTAAAGNSLGGLLEERGADAQAERWYRWAAENGDPDGLYNLGAMLARKGRTDEAEHWLRAAAGHGDPDAAMSLAAMSHQRGAAAEAEQWWRQAAAGGNVDAAFNVGTVLERRGDTAEAERWYEAAASSATGHQAAAERLATLRARRPGPAASTANRPQALRPQATRPPAPAPAAPPAARPQPLSPPAPPAAVPPSPQPPAAQPAAASPPAAPLPGLVPQSAPAPQAPPRLAAEPASRPPAPSAPQGPAAAAGIGDANARSEASDGFQRLLAEHVATSLGKQRALGELLGDHRWFLDVQRGTVDFGENRVFPVQLLGTESTVSNTWLWAWANDLSEIPGHVLNASERLRELGREQAVDELTRPIFPLSPDGGHLLALVASGICQADGYYRGPYDSGAVYFLIFETGLERRRRSAQDVAMTIQGVIMTFGVDHHAMAAAYLQQEGWAIIEESPAGLRAVGNGGEELRLRFDGAGRLAEIGTGGAA